MKIKLEVRHVLTRSVTLDTNDFIDNPSNNLDDQLVQMGDLYNDIRKSPRYYLYSQGSSNVKSEDFELQGIDIKPVEE